jgi:N12 class adenine-specific DNA methylase/adenine-specific DNA methylase
MFDQFDLFSTTTISSGLGLFPVDAAPPLTEVEDHDPVILASPARIVNASDFRLDGDRALARGWRERARDNLAAIRLAAQITAEGRPATAEEQAILARFVGFGATDLAQNVFRRPGEKTFRRGWTEIGEELEQLVARPDYSSLARCTQYAHYTPEPIVRAIWAGLTRLGFAGGRVLEPGMGTGLFPALMPENLRARSHVTGIEIDPVTARIARLLHPCARILNQDFARADLPAHFDLAIGNPPFSDRIVRSDPAFRDLALRLHDFFIVKAIDRLKPGGLAAFVTSTGTMDKVDATARRHIADMADLVGAIRLPEASMRDAAGTDVVVDVLFFRKRQEGDQPAATSWLGLAQLPGLVRGDDVAGEPAPVHVNRTFVDHPDMVLGTHALGRGQFGETYTVMPTPGADLAADLAAAILRLPAGLYDGTPEDVSAPPASPSPRRASLGAREGSYVIGRGLVLMQIVDGEEQPVAIKKGRGEGIFPKHARIIRKLIPIREAVREILKAQERDLPWQVAQGRLRTAWSTFVREFGPINATVVSTSEDEETGEVRESHRRPNLYPFQDDPDCWLVASIEDYDLDTDTAKPGPIFSQRVIAPPSPPAIASAPDALAVVLNERGHIDVDHIAELLHVTPEEAIAELGEAIYRDPATGAWLTSDAYLSGAVRQKLAAAEGVSALDEAYRRNVEALREVQPADLRPSDISARLGAPWIPAEDVVAFAKDVLEAEIGVHHTPEIASWTVDARSLRWSAIGTSGFGTHRRDAGQLLSDALNSSIPQIFDTFRDADGEKRILNVVETEAAKEKLTKIKETFGSWVWTDPDRTDRLARLYNDRFNNIVPRAFDGRHLNLPGTSGAFALRDHQKRVVWRIVSAGATYIAHAVGAGKTLSIAAAIMEQRRLGLVAKAMLVVPGHCLAQAAREFLALYPTARILVADETNFVREKRHRFLARAATATWDAIIITHSAFKFIAAPAGFEREMIAAELASFEALAEKVDREDRLSRKRLERMKEGLAARLEALASRKDDLLTIAEIGIDQIVVDEAQEFRKLSFQTNMTALRGIDPNGSQRAWDLFVKARFLETKNPGRALILASGTPITNTIGEMYTVQRFMDPAALEARKLAAFDAWAATFGDASTELELQPSGKYKPVTRFAQFVNVPELIAMFRSTADVVQPEDLRQYVKVPAIMGGKRQIVTAPATPAFKAYQALLDSRIKTIEARRGPPKKGEDILLSVIGDGRHAAIDLRLVAVGQDNEPENKLNLAIGHILRIWRETGALTYRRRDNTPFERPGAGQLIFCDLGTIAAEAKRGFSAYRWIKDELVRLGVPAAEIAFMQDFRKSEVKARLFADFNAGRVRILIGSSETMGTGVNVQLRLQALHHLDVPWLPSQIEQREGRIIRQGNSHDEVEIYAYATLGSLDATMWQQNERKARFIAAALSGDTSVRRLEDLDGQANQFAMATAIASGDERLMQKAGLEAEIARLCRLEAAHFDDQHAIRRQLRDAESSAEHAKRRFAEIAEDLGRRNPTAGDAFRMMVAGSFHDERKAAGQALMKEVLTLVQLQQEGDHVIASIGAFELTFSGRTFGREGFLFETCLQRTGYEHEITLDMTVPPLGAVSRLERALDGFEAELESQEVRLADAERRIASYRTRVGGEFALGAELAEKRARLAAIEADLAAMSTEEQAELAPPAQAA